MIRQLTGTEQPAPVDNTHGMWYYHTKSMINIFTMR